MKNYKELIIYNQLKNINKKNLIYYNHQIANKSKFKYFKKIIIILQTLWLE